MSLLAGALAEQRFTRRRHRVGASEDDAATSAWAGRICGTLQETKAYIAWLRERTKFTVNFRPYWRLIRIIAKSLLEHREMTGHQLRQVYKRDLLGG